MALRQSFQALRSVTARRALLRNFSVAPHAADKFVVEFPQEHEGLNIEFNWSLADDDVTPHGDAFRNLSWPKLEELAKQEKPAGKKVAIEEVDVSIVFNDFEGLYEKVTEHLSTEPNLYTQDGAAGSFQDDRTRVRVISDSPVVALFAQSLLVRVPIKDPHAARPIVVYVATGGEFKDKDPQAQLLMDNDDEGATFVKVVITGAADLSTIKDSIGLAKKKLLDVAESGSLVVPADVLVKDNKTALVFNATGAGRAAAINNGQLYSAHLSIWNPLGVTSLFGGAIVDAASKVTKKHVLAVEDGLAVNVPCNNLVEHPKAAVFVDKAAKGVKSISSAEAAALLKKVDSDVDVEKFEALLKKANTKSFVVSSDAEVDAALAKQNK
ncbi:Phosphoenolpyruvate carboxykinase [Phytophthora infestans]|uniref:Phosphoenolpyruvate carboxykinase n=1 Tax=Phytophthora infestans TaxID=4787 RepID=A0A833SU55_PHYIN|nr:Phosphoenolpyruvate carboxykinase [Phytophthora infestans]